MSIKNFRFYFLTMNLIAAISLAGLDINEGVCADPLFNDCVSESVSTSNQVCESGCVSQGECSCCDSEIVFPDYGGDLWCRSFLTGDWHGRRSDLAENGITFEGNVTQFYQGVVKDGREQKFSFGGHNDYVFNFDMHKLGLWEGLFLKLRAETQYGEFVNNASGALIPVNNSGVIPAPNEHTTALTNVLFTQFLSENFAVSFGKLDTLDGDANAFAHGRGKTQFMNSAFVFNPTGLRNVPYSTLGVAFTVLHNMKPILSFSIIDSEDSATTNGIDDLFSNGATLSAEARLPVEFLGDWAGRS